MRKVLLSLVAVSTLAVAAPASAQHYSHRGSGIERQLDEIANRIERAEQRRAISRREAASLLRRADQIDRLHDRYARNGLDRREMAQLQRQIHDLRQDLRFERRDRDGRRG
ncbi:hypothetical protein IC614_05275 [Allosphingosinicella flava]|uniref:Uncharacterized protein n=1 Tax=Allosphingosinicella flava TaxID=2771430 RepID=A0A7T2LMX1_9SPHN|nr:hypothetical protein [Sphingosinicella flava]QPQ55991.1 hypothetical protein IC614_05275 [Sphingosinicella flava]